MAGIFRVITTWNMNDRGIGHNVFYAVNNAPGTPPDANILAVMDEWLDRMFSTIAPVYISDTWHNISNQVSLLSPLGNVIREIGGLSPIWSGGSPIEPVAEPTTISITARTAVPRVRARKSISGGTEQYMTDGLWVNAAVNAASEFLNWWLNLTAIDPQWAGGTISSKVSNFVPFNGSGVVKNIPGTMVTRKPGRGS